MSAPWTPLNSTVVLIIIIVMLFEAEEIVQSPATIRLMENSICQRHYAATQPDQGPVDEHMCKIGTVQRHLAVVRAWYTFSSNVPILVFGAIFGSLADRFGRRPMLGLALFGMICAMAWIFIVCYFWNFFHPEMVYLTGLFRLLGGGPFQVTALYMTVATDITTEANRAQTFYTIFSCKLITDLLSPQIASASMSHSLWLPYLLCEIALLLALLVLLSTPETLPAKEQSQYADDHSSSDSESAVRTWMRLLSDWRILLGVLITFLCQFRFSLIQILLPYISVRFDAWTISRASALLTIVYGTNLVLFLLLPRLTSAVLRRGDVAAVKVNLWVTQMHVWSLLLASIITALSESVASIGIALSVLGLGFSIRAPLLAVMSGYAEGATQIASLYSLAAVTDAASHVIGSLVIEYVWARAVDIGGRWFVLPFVVITGIFTVAAFLVLILPPASPQVMLGSCDERTEEEEALLRVEDRVGASSLET